jgi:hypothetical protein
VQAVQVELFQFLAAGALLRDLSEAEAEYFTQGIVAVQCLGAVDLAEILVFLEAELDHRGGILDQVDKIAVMIDGIDQEKYVFHPYVSTTFYGCIQP